MKVSELLQLDMGKKANVIALKEKLKELPFFVDKDEIGIKDLEVAFRKMCIKYPIRLSYIMPSRVVKDEDPHYSFMIMSGIKDPDKDEWLKTIYAKSLYEGMAKLVIFTYAYIKSNNKEKK